MIRFIQSGSEIKNLQCFQWQQVGWRIASYMTAKPLIKHVLLSFDGDAENILLSILMYLQIGSTYIYNVYPKLKSIFWFWSHRQTMF